MLGHSRASSSKRTSRSIAMVLSDMGSDDISQWCTQWHPWPLSYIFISASELFFGAQTCDPLWSKGMQGRSPVFRTVKSKSLGMDLEDVGTTFQIWQAELNLSVQTSESFRGKATLRTVHLCSSMFIYCTSLPVLRISGLILEVYQGSARQRPVHHCTTPGYGDRFGVGSVNVNEHDTMIHHEPFLASSMHHQNPSDQRDCQGTTRSEQCRVQGIRTICGHEHLWSCQKFGAFMCGAIPL